MLALAIYSYIVRYSDGNVSIIIIEGISIIVYYRSYMRIRASREYGGDNMGVKPDSDVSQWMSSIWGW